VDYITLNEKDLFQLLVKGNMDEVTVFPEPHRAENGTRVRVVVDGPALRGLRETYARSWGLNLQER